MIVVAASRIVIFNIEPESTQIRRLERELTVFNQTYAFKKVEWIALRHAHSKKLGHYVCLPRNYPLDEICKIYPHKEVVEDDSFLEPTKVHIPCPYTAQDKLQSDALEFFQGEGYWKKIKHLRQRVLSLQTGQGKTFCAIKHISDLGLLPIVIFHKESLIKKWKDDIMKFTGIGDDEIAIVSGKDSLDDIVANKANIKFVLGIHRTFSNIFDNASNGAFLVFKFFKEMGFGVKVFDEAHKEFRSMFLIDSVAEVKESLYLSATPGRLGRANKIFGYIIPRFEVNFGNQPWLKREKYHKVMYVTFNSDPGFNWFERVANDRFAGSMYNRYVDEISFTIYRNIITEYIKKLLTKKPTAMIVVLFSRTTACKKMHEWLTHEFPDRSVGLYVGTAKKGNLDVEIAKQIVVSNEKKMGEGQDCEVEVILNTVPLSGDISLEQLIGRLRGGSGKQALFVDITDTGFAKSRNWMKLRRKFIDNKFAMSTNEKVITESWAFEDFVKNDD